MKRIRRNGGARDILAPKAIAILYAQTDHQVIARLGTRLGYREFVSFRARNVVEKQMLREAGKID